MKTVTEIKKYNIYKYSELDDQAKENVKQWYLKSQDSYIFEEDCETELNYLFPNSELQVQFSLGYCQGDGFNIYGDISLYDLFCKLYDNFTEKEKKFFEFIFNNYDNYFKMNANRMYSYCICDKYDYIYHIIDELEYDGIRNIRYDTLEKFNNLSKDYMCNLCYKFEKQGYKYFYEISNEDMEEFCECNECWFTEDGKFYC